MLRAILRQGQSELESRLTSNAKIMKPLPPRQGLAFCPTISIIELYLSGTSRFCREVEFGPSYCHHQLERTGIAGGLPGLGVRKPEKLESGGRGVGGG